MSTMHTCIWVDIPHGHLESCDSINFIDKIISLLYFVLLLGVRIMH